MLPPGSTYILGYHQPRSTIFTVDDLKNLKRQF